MITIKKRENLAELGQLGKLGDIGRFLARGKVGLVTDPVLELVPAQVALNRPDLRVVEQPLMDLLLTAADALAVSHKG